jgi:hypothetical protein
LEQKGVKELKPHVLKLEEPVTEVFVYGGVAFVKARVDKIGRLHVWLTAKKKYARMA